MGYTVQSEVSLLHTLSSETFSIILRLAQLSIQVYHLATNEMGFESMGTLHQKYPATPDNLTVQYVGTSEVIKVQVHYSPVIFLWFECSGLRVTFDLP